MPPITVASLAVTPYIASGDGLPAGVVRSATHISHDTANARVNVAVVPGRIPNTSQLGQVFNAAGTAIYLPFQAEEIHSVRLPVPPPAGVDFFYTANLSGCKFYVDTIAGSNDLMVYHANTHRHGAPAGTPANFQNPLAAAILDALHNAAQADYAALPAPNNLVLLNVATLDKPRYFGVGALAEQRKARQGRTKILPGGVVGAPEFMGGCTIVGFYQAPTWRFYYQSWGDVEYDRPTGAATVAKALFTVHWNYIHKRIWKGVHHAPTMKVVEHAQFH